MSWCWDDNYQDYHDPWDNDFFDDSVHRNNIFEDKEEFGDYMSGYNDTNIFDREIMHRQRGSEDNFLFWLIELF